MKNSLNLILVLLLIAYIVSCEQDSKIESSENYAKINIYLIDAPVPYDELWVEILGFQVLPENSDVNKESSWITIDHEAVDKKINLIALTGDNQAYIGGVKIPAGKINQIRLILGKDNYLVKDGRKIILKNSSGQESGLKLKLDRDLRSGVTYDLVVDFDAARSIVQAGNSDQYLLKPVLRVVLDEQAVIQGTILPIEAKATVYGISQSDTVATRVDEQGYFKLRGLQEGTYLVSIVSSYGYENKELKSVKALTGQPVNLNMIQLNRTD